MIISDEFGPIFFQLYKSLTVLEIWNFLTTQLWIAGKSHSTWTMAISTFWAYLVLPASISPLIAILENVKKDRKTIPKVELS